MTRRRRPDGHEHQAKATGACFWASTREGSRAEDTAAQGARGPDSGVQISGRRVCGTSCRGVALVCADRRLQLALSASGHADLLG